MLLKSSPHVKSLRVSSGYPNLRVSSGSRKPTGFLRVPQLVGQRFGKNIVHHRHVQCIVFLLIPPIAILK